MSNLGSSSSLATTVTAGIAVSSVAVPSAVPPLAVPGELDDAAFTAAADALASDSGSEPAALPRPLATVLAAEAVAASDGCSSVSSGGGRKKERRHGKNMKVGGLGEGAVRCRRLMGGAGLQAGRCGNDVVQGWAPRQ